jgi:rare lipoprotein A
MPMPNRIAASSSLIRSLVTFVFSVVISITIAGCSQQAQPPAQVVLPPPPPPVVAIPHPTAPTKVTTASWYGPGFDGHTTSSGEIYHQQALTAASRTLPIGAHAKVTNLKTGKSVVVRINDHGPFVHGRGIDLSRAAAKKIGIDKHGKAKVAVTRVDRPADEIPDASTTKLAKKHDDALPTTPTAGTGATPPEMESSMIPTSMGSSSKESPPPSH